MVQEADLSPEETGVSLLACWWTWAWRSSNEPEDELDDFGEEEDFLSSLDVTIDKTVDDPVRMYLREIGQGAAAHLRPGDRRWPG